MAYKRHYVWVVQDRWKGEPWRHHEAVETLKLGRELLAKRRSQPEWVAAGDRQWRLVRRCISDTVLAD